MEITKVKLQDIDEQVSRARPTGELISKFRGSGIDSSEEWEFPEKISVGRDSNVTESLQSLPERIQPLADKHRHHFAKAMTQGMIKYSNEGHRESSQISPSNFGHEYAQKMLTDDSPLTPSIEEYDTMREYPGQKLGTPGMDF
jgi:hypothetical protein